ncbi:MAG: NifU family protein [Planctomycetes bacterium]|nr:NifU family protein [Planctomycetota bacterium]
MREKVEKSIESISLLLQGHGGNAKLVSLDEVSGVVKVALQGACAGCPHAAQTFKAKVEARLREDVPEIKEVVAVDL